jgi:hypothetical protein
MTDLLEALRKHYPRPEEAQALLNRLTDDPATPRVLYAPRRTGKTDFVKEDLMPAARKAFFPIYADLWFARSEPVQALLYALEKALDGLTRPRSRSGKIARTPVKGLSVLGSGITLGDEPADAELPSAPGLRIAELLERLHARAEKPLLLIIDEFQTLHDATGGLDTAAALRACLQAMRGKLFCVMTGSSRDKMSLMFDSIKASMHGFAKIEAFPMLGGGYAHALADAYSQLAGVRLDEDVLLDAFRELDSRPKDLQELIRRLAAARSTDIAGALRGLREELDQSEDLQVLWVAMKEIDRAVLKFVAHHPGVGLTSRQALRYYAHELGVDALSASSVANAVDRLRQDAWLMEVSNNRYRFETERQRRFVAARLE